MTSPPFFFFFLHSLLILLRLSNLHAGCYHYMEDLLALEQARQTQAPAHSIGRAASPLHSQAWEAGLSTYPDQQFAQFLLRGIRDGFRIGAREHGRHQSSKRNLQSAYEHPQIIRDYLAREERLGRIHRQELSTLPQLQVNPFGVIPKRHRPGKWRLIVDLSSPLDGALPFGLCSVPKIFSALADGLMLILYSRGVTLARHYLVDFLLLGPPSTQACQAALCSTLSTCEELGLPVAPEKTEGPGCSPSWGLKLTRWPVSYVFPKKNYRTSKQPFANGCNLGQDQCHGRRSGKNQDLHC